MDPRYGKLLKKILRASLSVPLLNLHAMEILNFDILVTLHHLQGFIIKQSPQIRQMSSTVGLLHMGVHDLSRHLSEGTVLLAIH